nr:MAG TPA: hypothetical protein [Bacteriophage sp.]
MTELIAILFTTLSYLFALVFFKVLLWYILLFILYKVIIKALDL